jgi:hypothetical protein
MGPFRTVRAALVPRRSSLPKRLPRSVAMVRIEVVLVEHGQEFRYVVAEESSLDVLREVVERLRAHFDGREECIEVAGGSSGSVS